MGQQCSSQALKGARSPDGEQQGMPVLLLRGDSWVMVAFHHDPALQEVTPDTMAAVRAWLLCLKYSLLLMYCCGASSG